MPTPPVCWKLTCRRQKNREREARRTRGTVSIALSDLGLTRMRATFGRQARRCRRPLKARTVTGKRSDFTLSQISVRSAPRRRGAPDANLPIRPHVQARLRW